MTIIRVLNKYISILTKHQRIRIVELFVLMVIGGFMEMLSVSLIFPFMESALNPEATMQKGYVQLICHLFKIGSHRTFLVFVAVVLAAVYILKNVYLLLQMMVQNRFVRHVMFSTQQRLLHSFLIRPYEYFLDIKSGEVMRIIKDDTTAAFNMMTSLVNLLAELVVSGMLVITIFFISPAMTMGMAVLLIILVNIILRVVRPALRRAGTAQRDSNAKMNLWLLQAIQGIKELKIMNKREFFENNYAASGRVFVRTTYINQTLSQVPRFFIEASMMASFFIVVAIMLYRGTELESIIPILSGVAMAAIRLLPSVNRISRSMAAVAFGEPMLDKLIENLKEMEQYERESIEEHNSTGKNEFVKIQKMNKRVELEEVTYQYPQGKSNVLCDASMQVNKGKSIGIVGPSGAGKTTAVDILLGLLRPQKGKVLVDGTDIEMDMEGWLSNIGYIPQAIFMLDGSIRENVAFGVSPEEIDDKKVWEALSEAALDDFVRTLPDGLDTQIGERGVRLSGGQRQRIGIARALYSEPSVLFFDEATSALDNETEAAIMESVNRLHGQKTMIIIAHRLTTIEGCDVVYRVDGGKIQREKNR